MPVTGTTLPGPRELPGPGTDGNSALPAAAAMAVATSLIAVKIPEAGAGQAAGSLSPGRARRPGEQVHPGVHRSYQDTVSVFAPPGPVGCFGTVCPGRDWPAPGPGPVMAAGDVPRLAGYLAAHPEVSVVEFTGADPLTMDTPTLRRFVEPLLTAGHLVSVRFCTAALARWPYRFTAGPDADELLRLFEQVCAGGKSLALIAELSHPRELEPEPARKAVRRIRGTGAVIYAEGTLAGTVNDAPGVGAALWRIQVRLGVIPRTMILRPVTGPGTHFRVTLARAQQIFAGAYANVSGLARTVRGPAMRDERGLMRIDGTAVADGRKMFDFATCRPATRTWLARRSSRPSAPTRPGSPIWGPPGRTFSSMAPVIMPPAGPRRPAAVMASGLYCA